MEYIYLLQREMDKPYNVFKAGLSTNLKKRLDAADYRRANIYLIRGVNNCTLAEEEVFKTLNELGFENAKNYYNSLKDDRMYNQFGNEDYIIKNDIYEVVDIINKICDKYKYTEEIKIPPLLNNELPQLNLSEVSPLLNQTSIPEILIQPNTPEVKQKIKIDYEHFKLIFKSDRLLYDIQDRKLFETFYSGKINTSNDSYTIESIMNITEIIFDRLYLKRSPKISSSAQIRSPFLTQVIKIDGMMIVGINTTNVYDPLEIKFYVPNNAFEKEILNWEIDGVLQNPIPLTWFRSHGYNCYKFA